MTNDSNDARWPPALFASQMQKASEEFTQQQLRLFEQLMTAGTGVSDSPSMGDFPDLGSMSLQTAVFKTRVQSGGRISIPDAERDALDIEEGDLVQAFVVPIKQSRGDSNE
ncbi:hypothetical protein E6P09_17980 (plasmid) [Haloferax mediterranei ATCC 33500]|uniref:Poly(3-hydroxyalkanoate) granule-associated 12 kDa protein n=2 Tax=Haloferax mediterranei TaxID=2252 RepID=I3R9Z1_HALMT|nr:AbrB/MazE/SpoVT family DNA-binding domain-containing protein [Haloferax mediterranei]AEU08667.1 GAP12 [Haloferax mediterranei]AFK21051.1 poly(3-hydroxyalkanoate) granule-associated 12 kDa protein [Haloferax mediterranei ATCC 33500]AHZ24089.1 hypothetical protein BM92_17945 [Haloferax mediterranei ATCC 33500]EMA05164.1 hypothetical protein C439_00155 [Haloferax mediterranei ATCC 33500]MDX5989761.1 AbrB/MazE/SpoVT family DNA-binding domain-containing protein [Haloferax mediterranei ATCC 33500